MRKLIEEALAVSKSYPEYRQLLRDLLAEGKTTGPNQSATYMDAATINQSRMDRLDRKARFLPELETAISLIARPLILLTITEGWCGDAAQIVPLINHMADASDKLEHRLVLRHEHADLIDLFLTDGGRGIPKILFLDAETHDVLGEYGPRPAPAQEMALDFKHKRGPYTDYDEYNKALHTWYARDKTQTAQRELLTVIHQLEAVSV